MKFFGRIGFIFLSFFVFSCHNFLSEPGNSGQNSGNGTIRVSGTLTFSNDIAPYIQNHLKDSRALPSLDSHQFTVLMQAQNSDNSQIVPITVTNNSFSVELSSGNWKFQTHIYYDSTSSPHVDFSSNDYCFSAEDTLTVGTTNINDFKLECEIDTSADVSVPLNFTVYKDTNITKFVFWKEGIVTTDPEPISYGSNIYATKNVSTAYTPGLNSFIIYFKDANDNVIYTLEDTILVLKGCENYIYVNNNEGYVDGGQIKITSDVIQKRHANKIYFVDSSVTDDSTRTGTFFDPVASIQKAVNLIDSVNDGTSEYEIRLNTDFTDNSTSSYSSTNMDSSYICLKGFNKPIKLKICSKDDTKKTIDVNRNSSHTGRVISAWSEDTTKTIDLTLENLILKGGCIIGGDGGALVINAGKLTIDNCEFIGNSSTNSGGAINIGNKHSTGSEIKNTKFDGNTCIGTTATHYGNGGAIYTQKAITFTDCVFTDNGAKGYNNDSVMNTKGLGGAIFAADNTSGIINGCTFIHNYSYSFGGTIYLGNKASITISEHNTNPTIFKFNYGHYANAIYLKSCGSGTYITINSNVYFNNSENDTGDSDAASYRANVKNSGTQAKYYSNNDIFITDQNILFNYLKSNADELPNSPPSEGSNSYYADKYTYAVLCAGSLAIDDTTKLFQETNNSTNHLHKFIKCFNTASPVYAAPYNQSISRSPVFNNEGTATFRPYASDLVQLPEKLMIYIHNQADLEQLLKLYENSTTSKSNIVLQTADITCSSFSLTNCTFRDVYDGQGYKISGLQLTSADTDDPAALFGTIKNAQLKNINIVSPTIKGTGGETKVGTLCGTLINSKIDGCSVTGGTVMGKKYIGGLVSVFDTQDSADASCIINSSFQGTIQNTNNNSSARIGGLLGKYNSTNASINIINCFFNGQITNPYTTNIKSGFIAGELNDGKGQILNCYVHGLYSQSGTGNYLFTSSNTDVINCYADYAGFTAEEKAKIPNNFANNSTYTKDSFKSNISDSYLSGDLVIYGDKSRTKVDIYKYNGSAFISDSSNLSPDYTISMALNDFYTKNNAIDSFITTFGTLKPWTYSTEDGIHFSADGTATAPKTLICPALVISEPDPTTLGSTPIWIRCEDDFFAIDGWNKGNTIELKNNINMVEIQQFVGSTIDKQVSFKLNGNNHTISYELIYTSPDNDFEALIGYANSIQIKDLTIIPYNYCLDADAKAGSFLIARLKRGTIENCNINVDGYNSMGYHGLIDCNFGCFVGEIVDKFGSGDTDNQTHTQVEITRCNVSGYMNINNANSIKNFNYGGFIGRINKSPHYSLGYNPEIIINKCKNLISDSGLISISTYNTIHLGGIIGSITGSNYKTIIKNCINNQDFELGSTAAGTGYAYISGFTNLEYFETPLEIQNCLQNADVLNSTSSGNTFASGCVTAPSNFGDDYVCNTTIKNCIVTKAFNATSSTYYVVTNEKKVSVEKVYYYIGINDISTINFDNIYYKPLVNSTTKTQNLIIKDGSNYYNYNKSEYIIDIFMTIYSDDGEWVFWNYELTDFIE